MASTALRNGAHVLIAILVDLLYLANAEFIFLIARLYRLIFRS